MIETIATIPARDSVGPVANPAGPAAGQVGGAPRRIALLMPVLDDWACFSALIADISTLYTGLGVEFTVCAIDDGSIAPFDPAGLTLEAETCIREIEVIRLALNLGHQRAIAVGLCALAERDDLDAVVVIDSDGEDRPNDIAALLSASAEHSEHVILARRDKRSETLGFRLLYRAYKLVFYALTGQALNFGNFSLLPMTAVRRLVHMPELWNNLAASLIRSRLRCTAVSTIRGHRYTGRSRLNFVGLIVHGLAAMSVHLDTIFVRVLLASLLLAAASLFGIVSVATIRLTTELAIPGWATTAVGALMVVLLQTLVVVVAATLTMLAGRSARPIIPRADAPQFVAARERFVPVAGRF